MKIKVKDTKEKAQVEVDLDINGKAGKVLFQSTSKDKSDTLISFDMGQSWIPLDVAHASITEYLDKYPFALPQE